VKVLILHQHFNTPVSGGPLRSYYLAKALLEKGIGVAVITGWKNPNYHVDNFEGIEIHYLPIAYDNRFGFYKRGLSFVRYAIDALSVAKKIPNVNLCYAISVPLTVGQSAIWIERRLRIPFYFEVGDLWPDAPIQMGFIQNPVLKQSLLWLEKRIYSRARHIIALSEPIRNVVLAKTGGSKLVSVIPNMADVQFFKNEPKNPEWEAKYSTYGKFVVSYTGAIGFANGLDYFMECARSSKKANLPIKFILCGDGAMTPHLKSVRKTLDLENLDILPFTGREGIAEILNVSDATFICYKPFPILETGSPNKYFDGLAAGKLIILNFNGWMRDEIEQAHCGVALDPRLPHEFAEKIRPFLEDTPRLRKYQQNARKVAEEKYARSLLSQRFASLFETI
jgi:glycosyltransferase involved in cell wall biosynthesis